MGEQWTMSPVATLLILAIVLLCCCGNILLAVACYQRRAEDRITSKCVSSSLQSREVNRVVDMSLELQAVDKVRLSEVSTQDDTDDNGFSIESMYCADDDVVTDSLRHSIPEE